MSLGLNGLVLNLQNEYDQTELKENIFYGDEVVNR